MVGFAIEGYADEMPDDPIFIIPPMPIDQLVIQGPMAKQRLEDLQVLSCLEALSLSGWVRHPVSLQPGSDPPDRVLTVGTRTYGLELTELTMRDVRASLARVRQVGRLVDKALHESEGIRHLAGRQVAIMEPELRRRLSVNATATRIVEALHEDRGYVGEGVDFTNGLPVQWTSTRGFYGDFDGLHVQTFPLPAGAAQAPQVVAAVQGTVRLSQLRALVLERIAAKDKPHNEVLIMTAGLLDKAGFICPLDLWLAQILGEHGLGPVPAPSHIEGVLLHRWGSHELTVLYERNGALLPWLRTTR